MKKIRFFVTRTYKKKPIKSIKIANTDKQVDKL